MTLSVAKPFSVAVYGANGVRETEVTSQNFGEPSQPIMVLDRTDPELLEPIPMPPAPTAVLAELENVKHPRPLFHIPLAERRDRDYTWNNVVQRSYSDRWRVVFHEMFSDIGYEELLEGDVNSRNFKTSLMNFGSFFFVSGMPHELIHAAVAKLSGSNILEIVMNRLYGGDFWATIIPGVETKVLFPLIAGYVRAEQLNPLLNVTMGVAPYIMTPLGLALVKKGKDLNKPLLCFLGAGTVVGHAGGIIGDFRMIGMEILTIPGFLSSGPEYIANMDSFTVALAFLPSLYIGSFLMKLSYRISKLSVDTLMGSDIPVKDSGVNVNSKS